MPGERLATACLTFTGPGTFRPLKDGHVMAQFPAMPFWFDAYYRDTQHLTYEEHGIYLHLIKLLWHAPAQRIPNDRAWLERRFKEHTPQAMVLIDEFCIRDRKWITQSRVMREFQWVAETGEKQRDKAKSRWQKEKDPCHGITVADAAGMPPIPIPIPIPIHKKEDSKPPRVARGAHLIPEDWKPNEKHTPLASQLGLSTEQMEAFACQMQDWSKGAGKKRTDWDATFNNWIRREAQRLYKPNGKHEPPPRKYKTYRPPGWTDDDERRLDEKSTRYAGSGESLLDQGATILGKDRH